MTAPFRQGSLRTAVKERLRGARFLARELRESALKAGGAASGTPTAASAVIGTIADVSDTALARLESLALGLVSADPKAHFSAPPAHPLAHYFAAPGAEGRERFARDLYFAAKRILQRKGAGNPSISEEALARAYGTAAAELNAAGWRPESGDLATLCAAAAAVALALAAARPVVSPALVEDRPSRTAFRADLYVALALGLALAVASFHEGLEAEADVHGAAMAALDIRFAAIEAALDEPEPAARLARIFEELTPRLP